MINKYGSKFRYNYKREGYIPPHYLVPAFVMPPCYQVYQFNQIFPTIDVYNVYFLRLFGVLLTWRGFKSRESSFFSFFIWCIAFKFVLWKVIAIVFLFISAFQLYFFHSESMYLFFDNSFNLWKF